MSSRGQRCFSVVRTRRLWIRGPMLGPLSKESRDMPIKERFVLATSFRDVSLPSERVEPAISGLSALELEVQRHRIEM